jgi:hypothetical protein
LLKQKINLRHLKVVPPDGDEATNAKGILVV